MAAFRTMDDASNTVSAIIGAGIVPSAIEMMDQLSTQAVEASVGAGYPLDAGGILLVEVDGVRDGLDDLLDRIETICRAGHAQQLRVATTALERDKLWAGRKGAFAAMGRLASDYYVQDGVIPRTSLPEVLARIDELSRDFGLRVANVFHAGDGNLHPLVCYDGAVPGETEAAAELAGRILEACVEAGGSITGEHGIGLDKKSFMPLMFGEADLDAFQRLRCAFDPDGRVNPGKVMPTPRLCGEVPGPYRRHPLEEAGVAERL